MLRTQSREKLAIPPPPLQETSRLEELARQLEEPGLLDRAREATDQDTVRNFTDAVQVNRLLVL